MKLSDRVRTLLDGMPDEASVTLPVTTLREWLDESGPSGFEPDLTVREVATYFGRAPSTITAWIRAGELRAYRLKHKEYRIPRSALKDFQEQQSRGQSQGP